MAYKEIEILKQYMTFEEMSNITQQNYLFYVAHYLRWLEKQKYVFAGAQLSNVIEFIDYRNKHTTTHKPLSQNSINLIKASLRALYIANKKPEIATLIRGKNVGDKIPETISQESIMKILDAALVFYSKPAKAWKNELTYFFISLLYQSGGRISELTNLTKNDVDFKYATIKLGSKGSEYLRKLNKVWLLEFKKWVEKNKIKTFVFVDSRGRQFPKRSMQWIIEKLCERSLGKKYSAHRFRASCITHRLQAGEEFFSVSSNFHKHVDTTRKYLGATARSLEKMINPLEVLNK